MSCGGACAASWRLHQEKDADDALTAYFEEVGGKTPRYYQQVAINRAVDAVLRGQTRILLTMATGTGKTFVAFQIVWRLVESRTQEAHPVPGRPQCPDRPGQRPHLLSDGRGAAQDQGAGRQEPRSLFCPVSGAGQPRRRASNLYEQYPKDFFDLIIVDECHRGSASEESNWRKILEYFEPAPADRHDRHAQARRQRDTYEYFGEPIYTYSLKQGIEDGFLAPYRVYRVIPDVDAQGLQIDPGVLDRFGREIPPDCMAPKNSSGWFRCLPAPKRSPST